jgi:S1/P1 nuclease
VGDMHQPLHVGSIYLDASGHRVNPDHGTYNPETDTHGGNSLMISSRNMHSKWDAVPASLKPSHVDDYMDDAEAISATNGQLYDWPATWAGDTISYAKKAFAGLKFGSKTNGKWATTLPVKYSSKMNGIKKTQITKAGAHLSQLLEAIWP